VASSTFIINISGGTLASCALEEYSGVFSLGATGVNSGTSNQVSVSLPIPEANDFVVAGLGANSYNGYAPEAGTLRQAGGLAGTSTQFVEMDLCDNTATSAGTVTCSAAFGSSPWAAPALVLR
jgi:hypothetical protein